jgi:hypothetical protein
MPLLIMALGGDKVDLTGTTVSHVVPGGSATAGFRIDADGQIYYRQGGSYIAQYSWVTPNGNAGNYECRWVTGGSTPDTTPAASGTWVACTSDRTWEENAVGTDVIHSFTVELRRAGTSTVLKSVTIGLAARGAP